MSECGDSCQFRPRKKLESLAKTSLEPQKHESHPLVTIQPIENIQQKDNDIFNTSKREPEQTYSISSDEAPSDAFRVL